MAGKITVWFIASLAVFFIQPVFTSDEYIHELEEIVEQAIEEEMFHHGQSVLLTRGNLTDRDHMDVLEISGKGVGLSDDEVNNIFKEVFVDIKAGLPNVGTIISSYSARLTEARHGCKTYSLPSQKELACDLVILMRQLNILKTFQDKMKVTHVRSLLEFKDYSLPKYLAQLKLSKEFRSNIASISFDTNVILTVTQEQAKKIGTYFKEAADFDRQIADQDRIFLEGRLNQIQQGSADMWADVKPSLENIMKAAVGIASVAVAEATLRLAMELAECCNPIKLVLGGCSPEDIIDRLADLMGAIRTLAKAVKLLDGLSALSTHVSVLKANFEKNGEAITKMKDIVLSFSTLSEADKMKKVKEYLDAYNNYSPQVTAQDLANIANSLEYTMDAGCEIIRDTETFSVAGLVVDQVIANDCNKISSKVAQLTSYYTDWFSFQFEVIDSFTKMVRGDVAKVYSTRLTTMNTQVKVRETVLGLTMDEIKLQTAATGACNVFEYKAGGTRPSICKTGFFNGGSVNTLIAYTGFVSLSKVKTFAWIPTAPPTSGNKTHIDVDKLLNGETVRFQLPLDDTTWMGHHHWLPNTNNRGTAYFIERMDLYVPGLKCTDGTAASISVEITNEKAVGIFTESAPPKYLIAETEMKFQFAENSPFCQPCAQVDFPVKANGDTSTVQSTVKVCVRSNGIVPLQENTLLPPMYAAWRVRLRQESCTLQKDTSLGYVPMITASITRVQMATNIDECWPNPCPNGHACTDEILAYRC